MAKQKRTRTRSSPYPVGARSFELKLARARVHLDQLKVEIEAWVESTLKTMVEEPEPDDPRYYGTWITSRDIDEASLSLLVGDALQCLRSSLDHLAFELAAAFTVPLPNSVEKDSEFPIFGDEHGTGESRFHQLRSKGPLKGQPTPTSGLNKTRGMDTSAQAIIERLQPYHRGHAYADHPLWLLTTLNNVDKHRAIHLVGAVLDGVGLPVNGPALPRGRWSVNIAGYGIPGEVSRITVEGGPVEPDRRTKVVRCAPILTDPNKKMRMNLAPRLDVQFDTATPSIGGESAMGVLGRLHDYVLTDVIVPLIGFLK